MKDKVVVREIWCKDRYSSSFKDYPFRSYEDAVDFVEEGKNTFRSKGASVSSETHTVTGLLHSVHAVVSSESYISWYFIVR